MSRLPFALLLGLSLWPATAPARDGVIEINQARARAGGITPGDTPNFPVQITTSGSYVLTGDLASSTSAIEIFADDVTIDLGGFELRGPVSCGCCPASCPAPGLSGGVLGTTQNYVRVSNGTLRGFDYGVALGGRAIVDRVHVLETSVYGIYAGPASLVEDSSVRVGGSTGILVFAGSRVERSTAQNELGDGIAGHDGCILTGNKATDNGGHGLYATTGCVLEGNAARQNSRSGVYATGNALLLGNTETANAQCGAVVGPYSLLRANTTAQNGIAGMRFLAPGATTAIGEFVTNEPFPSISFPTPSDGPSFEGHSIFGPLHFGTSACD
jgi:parallel beta-helix repeat protein